MNIGIIGHGRFGRLWAKSLKGKGYVVKMYDPRIRKERIDTDLLFLLVPISSFEQCCKKVAPLLSLSTIVVDACSVKMYPARVMRTVFHRTQPLIATHPLFGPDSVRQSGIKGKKIVVSYLRASSAQQKRFEQILQTLQLTSILSTAQRHDQQMARSQALVHFIGRGLEPLRLRPQLVATPDYETLLRMTDLVHHDTQQLFRDLQNYNPYSKRMRQTFVQNLQRIERTL
ncbi:prephenate dehydrogenase [Candidatus Uhrbacteria bacterium]|nr:prephenate dehydrogenase [Candidatus Uhrbacteria bacterium]